MSFSKELVSRKLIVAVAAGTTTTGNPKYSNRTFNNVAEDADAAALGATANAFKSLIDPTVGHIYVDDKSQINEQA